MHFPAALHLPSVFGTALGVGLFLNFWPGNKPLAIVLLVVCITVGIVLGLFLSDMFYRKGPKGDE